LEENSRGLFGEEAINFLPYLASLLALQLMGEYAERLKYLDGEALGKQIFLTTRRFFERLACNGPAVLSFEDLHWMDESSTLLLELIPPLVERLPILILGLTRPEQDTPAAHLRERCLREFDRHYTEIRLTPLSATDSVRVVHNLMEIDHLPEQLGELIVAKAEGNPFFGVQ
jgi:predicted ATPase